MTPPVWGTFSVRDHVHPEAFLREVLLFDRLVVPYPDPSFPDERARWYRPNPEDETENWQPDRLDELLAVLGTADAYGMAGADGHHGARCVQPVVWNPNTWQEMKTRLGAAGMLDADPFLSTARGVIFGPDVPAVVDAVAAYRSEADWRAEAGTLTRNPPSDVSTHDAIMQLARPLLLPPRGHDELETLRRAVDLAREPGYVSLRHAYYDWFREFTTRIRPDNPLAPGISLDPASLWLAAEELRALEEGASHRHQAGQAPILGPHRGRVRVARHRRHGRDGLPRRATARRRRRRVAWLRRVGRRPVESRETRADALWRIDVRSRRPKARLALELRRVGSRGPRFALV